MGLTQSSAAETNDPVDAEQIKNSQASHESYHSYWTGTSRQKLQVLEEKFFRKHVSALSDDRDASEKASFTQRVVGGLGVVEINREQTNKPPLVMIHGYGACNVMWSLCVDQLAKHFRLYLVEMHGHGRSDRVQFPAGLGPAEAEIHMAQFIERWRQEMPEFHNEPFILVGHSLGAMVSWRYASLFPERVKHLILASPCGVPEKPDSFDDRVKNASWFFRYIIRKWENGTSPMDLIRSMGPLGKALMGRIMQRRMAYYAEESAAKTVDVELLCDIMHQSWGLPESGERAMNAMLHPGAYAKLPLVRRILDGPRELETPPKNMPISIIYGDPNLDWMRPGHGLDLVAIMKQAGWGSYLTHRTVDNAGHMVPFENPSGFSSAVIDELVSGKTLKVARASKVNPSSWTTPQPHKEPEVVY